MRRLDRVDREKIAKRVRQDREQARARPIRLELGRWHWVRLGLDHWRAAKILELDASSAVVGFAELGTTERIALASGRVGRRLTGEEMSDHLRREPVAREWPPA